MIKYSTLALAAGICVTGGAMAMTTASGNKDATAPDTTQTAPPAEQLGELDCHDACIQCQKPCDNYGCKEKCTVAAAGCCAAHGKKPPLANGCFCQ